MRIPRWTLFWIAVIAALLLVEIAEITRQFTVPVQSALFNVYGFIFALFFTTTLALVGAVFIGIYISHRVLSPRGFTPFEEEMLRMRAEVLELRRELAKLRGGGVDGPPADPPAADEPMPAGPEEAR